MDSDVNGTAVTIGQPVIKYEISELQKYNIREFLNHLRGKINQINYLSKLEVSLSKFT
jgi:hypothetical protein